MGELSAPVSMADAEAWRRLYGHCMAQSIWTPRLYGQTPPAVGVLPCRAHEPMVHSGDLATRNTYIERGLREVRIFWRPETEDYGPCYPYSLLMRGCGPPDVKCHYCGSPLRAPVCANRGFVMTAVPMTSESCCSAYARRMYWLNQPMTRANPMYGRVAFPSAEALLSAPLLTNVPFGGLLQLPEIYG